MAMSLKTIAIFCLAIVPISHCNENIDALMSGEEIQQIFHTDANSVPMHEVIEINFHQRNKRDLLPAGTRITIRAFGEDHQLWLHPVERVLFKNTTPIYSGMLAYNWPENIKFTRNYWLLRQVGRLYENSTYLASLVIGEDAYGRSTATGHIGKRDLAIKPLPHDFVTKYLRKKRSNDNSSSPNSALHVVYKTNGNFEQSHSIGAIDKEIREKRDASSTHQVPSVIYPKILVYTDYTTYRVHSFNKIHLLEYMMAFWNGVDLRYRTLESPKVRFHISALVIALDEYVTPYIRNNMVPGRRDAFDTMASYNASQYFFSSIRGTFPLTSYDVAVTMTNYSIMATKRRRILGFAYSNSVCLINEQENIMRGVAFVQDQGEFTSVHTAAHELGHTIGMYYHDGERNNCSGNDGHLMAAIPFITKNSSTFSECSIRQFQRHLDDQKLTCLYNEPQSIGEDMPKIMPGKLMNLKAQCAAHGQGLPCDVEDMDICVDFYCLDSMGECLSVHSPAADGTSCEISHDRSLGFCLKNECVHLPHAERPTRTRAPTRTRGPFSWD